MKKSMNHLISFSLVASIIFFSCTKGKEQGAKPMAKNLPFVSVQPASGNRLVSAIDITGTVYANIYSEVKSPSEGVIESLMARENQWVEKDKIIAVINPTDRIALISHNQLQIEQTESKIKNVDKESEEYTSLITELEKANSNLEYAKNMFATIPVISPMSGLVTQRFLDNGSQVSAKEKIITISDMNSLVIKAEVNEQYFEAVKKGDRIPLKLNAYPNDDLTGIVSLIYPQVDPVSRSFKFDIKIQNFRKSLLPGMMAYLSIPVSVKDQAISINEEAVLITPDNKRIVFVVDSDTVAHRRVVETGLVSGKLLEIVKGVEIDEKVVIAGQEMLKDKMKVRIAGTPKSEKQ